MVGYASGVGSEGAISDTRGQAWILAVAYAAVALLALRARAASHVQRERLVWALSAAVLVTFGAAKQLNLQEILTNWLRTWFREHNIYQSRLILQVAFLLVVLSTAWFILIRLKAWLKSSSSSVKIASMAMAALVAFVLVRAASFHALDAMMTTKIAGLRSGWWIEFAALGVVAAAAGTSVRENHPA
jgi:hypothetical protein